MANGNLFIVGGKLVLHNGKLVLDDAVRNQRIPFDDFEEWKLSVTMGHDHSTVTYGRPDGLSGYESYDFVTAEEYFYPINNTSLLTFDDTDEFPLSFANEYGSVSDNFELLGCGNMRTLSNGTIVLPLLFLMTQSVSYSKSDNGDVETISGENKILCWYDVEFENPTFEEGNLVPMNSKSINLNFYRSYTGTNGQSCECSSDFYPLDFSPGYAHVNSGDLFR